MACEVVNPLIVAMRHFLMNNVQIFSEINCIKKHLISSDLHQFDLYY